MNGVLAPDGRRMVACESISSRAGIDAREEGLDLVVSERPEQPVGNHHGRRRSSDSRADTNDTNHVSPLASRAVKPGAYPAAFSRMMTHFSGAGGGPTLGPRTNSGSGSAPGAIGEPARVGYFVDGVDVLRAGVRRRTAGSDEQIDGEVVEESHVPRLSPRRILGVRVASDGVVVVKAAALRRRGGDRDGGASRVIRTSGRRAVRKFA